MTRLVAFTAAWALGIVLARAAFLHPAWFLLSAPAILVLNYAWRHDRRVRLVTWALAGLLLGVGRFGLVPTVDEGHVARYNGTGAVTLTGVVVAEPDARSHLTNLRLEAETLALPAIGEEPQSVHGSVLVKAPVYTPAFYGDRIQVTGDLETPPVFEDFSYRDYLARQGVHSILRGADVAVLESHQANRVFEVLLRFKARALQRVQTILPEPEASLAAGILLGVESGIPEDLEEDFAATGTSHIVAISGFNLSVIAGLFAAVSRRLGGRRGEVLLALTGVWLYTLLVGASAAVLRAAVMGSVTIVALNLGRKQHSPTTLALAVFLMSALNPLVLWDVGFQLSLAATAGLIFLTDPLERFFRRLLEHFTSSERARDLVELLSEAFIVTLAAQITTTPIIVANFHHLSLVTLVTNFLVLPLQNFVMAFGGLALAGALLWLPLGQVLAWPAWVFLTLTIRAVEWTARFPLASVRVGRFGLPLAWGYYLVLGALLLWFSRPSAERRRWLQGLRAVPRWQFAGGFALLVLVGAYVYAAPDGRLHVTFLDVGRGDAILVQTPSGRQVVIDGGADSARLLSEVGRRMPFWDRDLDLVVLTSPDDERLAGLVPLLERYEVDVVVTGSETGRGPRYERWVDLLTERPEPSTGLLWAGSEWHLDEGVSLRALWPQPEGDHGPLVLHLIHGEVRILLMGDATTVVEEALVARDGPLLKSDLLQVARHGAATSTTVGLLQAVTPEVAVITGGKEPAPQVLARLMDCAVYRTDLQGSVEVISDGSTLRVRTER